VRALGRAFATWARRAATRPPARPPAWVHPGLARRVGLPRRDRRAMVHGGPVRDDVLGRLAVWWTEPAMTAAHLFLDQSGVEVRHPFLDRRVVEWALAVPPFRLGEDGRVKAPLRRALADLLPETVARRADKGNYAHYWDLGLRVKERARIERLLADPVAAQLGYVDAARLRRAYERYRDGGTINRQQLWNALTLEDWLRDRVGAKIAG
jgi:asparagine synthase (glutamine-hydrolysing)